MQDQKDKLGGYDRTIGQNIRKARQVRGLTQAELGRMLGVSFQQIQKYEAGKNRISASMLKLLAEHVGVSADSLLGVDSNQLLPSLQFRSELTTMTVADFLEKHCFSK